MGEKVEGEKKKAVVDGGGESVTDVVLNLDLHCEGCAKKVRKAVSRFEGVEKVQTDCTSNKLIVTGNVDPKVLRERIEYKTKKKVDLISPLPKKAADEKKKQKKTEDERKKKMPKGKEAETNTAVLRVKLHCDGCAHKVERVITKSIQGVNSVKTDLEQNLVIVTGTMDVNMLTSFLEKKLKRKVEAIPPSSSVSGVKMVTGAGDGEEKKVEVNKMEHRSLNSQTFYYNQNGYEHGHVADNYYMGEGHVAGYNRAGGPSTSSNSTEEYYYFDDQMFSDENPSGCSVM